MMRRWTWGCLLACLGGVAAHAEPVLFTGNALDDFPAGRPGLMVAADPAGAPDVGLIANVFVSGWDINTVRLAYDPDTDVLFVGFETFAISGDADGDGDAGRTSPALAGPGGSDLPDLGGSESIALGLDVDQDGIFDVVAGVASGRGLAEFRTATWQPGALVPGLAFNAALPQHTGAVFASPSVNAPHFEFTITNFSTLPTSGTDRSTGFAIRAFAGSLDDGGIGEDFVPGNNTVINLCPTPDAPEQCNGFDDDCDGRIDEGFSVGEVCTVGLGICAVDSVMVCDGLDESRCDAVPGDGLVETCNGDDDDCDGRTDEDFRVGEVCTVGVGACAVNSTFVCAGLNAGRCDAVAGQPSVEACDGIDNDCDGRPDEGFGVGQVCIVGVGICAAEGVGICASVDAGGCSVVPGPSAAESCNALDDDCDGLVDEGLVGNECTTGQPGVCERGRDTCVGGVFQCVPLVINVEETCDGLDNDCDGRADETFGVGSDCSIDANGCTSEGVLVCVPGGTADCNATPRVPVQETCNAIDDDCDGTVDEGFEVGSRCVAGLGVCATEGVRGCDAGGAGVCIPGVAPPAPMNEICDRLDNDCDGRTDEDFGAGDACSVGEGACHREAVIACNDDAEPVCTAAPGQPSGELCNRIDDDCDGRTDEGFDVGIACAEGQGVCRREGLQVCGDDGALVCDVVPGDPNAGEDCEIGLDDDCDGVVDEADDCGDSRPDAGLVVTGTDAIDNCNCDAGGRGSAPWWLAVLLFGGWRRRRLREVPVSTRTAGGGGR